MDADVLVYRAGFAAEHTFWKLAWGEYEKEFESKKELNAFRDEEGLGLLDCVISSRVEAEPESNALFNARSMIRTTMDKLETGDVILYLSGPTNFRLGIATIKPYKGNRDPDHKPVHAAAIKAMLRREYDVITSEGQEADDDISIAHYSMWLRDEYSTVIATIDKDLDMVPGLHYNFSTEERYYMEPIEGLRKFYEQLIKGDTTDNIPGISGMGKVKAAAAVAECKTEWEMYQKAHALYVQAYPDNPDAALLENARLLWMRREHDEWWNPPKEDPIANSK